jgi:hypothetical protein
VYWFRKIATKEPGVGNRVWSGATIGYTRGSKEKASKNWGIAKDA